MKWYHTSGFRLVRNAVSHEEMLDLRSAVSMVQEFHPERRGLRVYNILGKHEAFQQVLRSERVKETVAPLLGDSYECYNSHIVILGRGDRPHTCHQDMERRSFRCLKAVFYVSDCSRPLEGNTYVVPGSMGEKLPPDPSRAVPILAHPGDALFYNPKLWHTSGTNVTQKLRKAVFFSLKRT